MYYLYEQLGDQYFLVTSKATKTEAKKAEKRYRGKKKDVVTRVSMFGNLHALNFYKS